MEACFGVGYFLILTAVLLSSAKSMETDFTMEVKAGVIECVYQTIKEETTVEIEYQVIDGGDLDIGFAAFTPQGQLLASDAKKTENTHRLDVKLPGDYKFCLDNSFSRFSKKLVYFELMTDEDDDDDDWKPDKDEIAELVDMTIDDFKTIMVNVKTNLEKSQQLQNLLKTFEARDRNIQENNFTRVNVLSGIQLFVMISVGLVQVILIRQLFADRKTSQMKVQT